MAGRKDYNQSWVAEKSEFDTTQWTQILGAPLSQAVMGELYQKYRKPVYLYLQGKGFTDENARDLIQGFFSDKILGKKFLEKASPEGGHKFRSFLITSIQNYARDLHRAQKPVVSLDDENHDQPASQGNPALAFNQAWAIQLVQETLHDLENECLKQGKERQGKEKDWELIRRWLLEPNLEHGKVKLKDLCAQLKIATPNQASGMIHRLKERFRTIFRTRLRVQGYSPEEIDEEINSLLGVF